MKRSWLSAPYALWMVMFIVLPMLLIVYYAFTTLDGGFSMDNFRMLAQPMYYKVLANSLFLALISTLLCLLLGYPFAYFLANRDLSRSASLMTLIVVPMWMNFLLRTYAWVVLLEQNGPINMLLTRFGFDTINILYTPTAIVLGMVYNFLPFMVLPIYTVLSKMDQSYVEAAQDLGASQSRVFFKVVLPLSLPGIMSGITMTFMPAASTFIISRLLGGGKTVLFGDLIENQFLLVGNRHFGSALSLVLMVLVLLSMLFVRQDEKSDAQGGMLW